MDIPVHWQFVKLKHFITLQKGKNPQHFSENKKHLPYLTMEYLRGKTDTPVYAMPQNNLIEAFDNDLLILWDGANAGETIRAKRGYVSSTMAVINIKNPILNNEYLYFQLKWLEKTLKDFASGTTIPHLDASVLLNQKYALPPLSEQIAIATYLDRKLSDIDTFIAKKQRLVTLLQEQKAAMINKAVTKGLNEGEMRPSGIAWLGDIPAHWEVRKLKTIVAKKITDGPHETPAFVSEGIPFISAEAINFDGSISFENKRADISKELDLEYSKKCKPQIHDIFIVKSGSTTGKIGFVTTNLDFNIWSPLALVRTNINIAIANFIFRSLQAAYFQNQVKTSWSYGTQPNIGMKVLENLYIPVPPLSEQSAIVSHIETESARIDKAISLVERELTLVQEYRTALIAEAVTGKIKCPAIESNQPIKKEVQIIKLSKKYPASLSNQYQRAYRKNTDCE